MEGNTLKQEGIHTAGVKHSFCNGEEKRQLQQESSTGSHVWSCGRQDSPILVKHTADQNYRGFPCGGRTCAGEDSPVSVIFAASKHLMQVSHPSSACTSMEHPLHHLNIVSGPPSLFHYNSRRSFPSHEPAYAGSMSERVQQAFSKSHELTSTAKRQTCNLDSENIKRGSQLYNNKAKVMKPWPNYRIKGSGMEWLNLQDDPPLTPSAIHSKVYVQSHTFASSPDDEAIYTSTRDQDQDEESVIDFFPSAYRPNKHVAENSKEPTGGLSRASHREAGTEVGLESMRDMATQSTPTDWSRCESPEAANFSTADEKAAICGTCPEKGTSALKTSPPRHNTPARRSVSCSKESAAKPGASPAHFSNGKLNLLELENCHLDKLKLARDLPLGTSSTWQLYPDEDINQSLKLVDHHKTSLYENVKNHQHAKVNMLEARVSAWEDVERAKHIAKFKREEAKIEAWESLQRAEADAELRKLEVKLEKLRFEGREKIMGRLASAQRRAQEMRSATETHKIEQLTRVEMRANHIRKSGHLPSSTFNVVCSLTTKIKPTSNLPFA